MDYRASLTVDMMRKVGFYNEGRLREMKVAVGRWVCLGERNNISELAAPAESRTRSSVCSHSCVNVSAINRQGSVWPPLIHDVAPPVRLHHTRHTRMACVSENERSEFTVCTKILFVTQASPRSYRLKESNRAYLPDCSLKVNHQPFSLAVGVRETETIGRSSINTPQTATTPVATGAVLAHQAWCMCILDAHECAFKGMKAVVLRTKGGYI